MPQVTFETSPTDEPIRSTGTEIRSLPPTHDFADKAITSTYDRDVDVTCNIAGKLPNRVFTMRVSTILAVMCRAEVSGESRELPFLCRKFFMARQAFLQDRLTIEDGKMCLSLSDGRLYTEGGNNYGQCGVGSTTATSGPRWVRLPPVVEAWYCIHGTFALTSHGLVAHTAGDGEGDSLHAWGNNWCGKLGVGLIQESVTRPRRVVLPGAVRDVRVLGFMTLFRVDDDDWLGCGFNQESQIGVPHDPIDTDYKAQPVPTRIPGSAGVTRWEHHAGSTFAWTPNGLLMCGNNGQRQSGCGSTDNDTIKTLTPVILPERVRVDRVVATGSMTFFFDHRRCFACGDNMYGQLGLALPDRSVFTPRELPFPVDAIATVGWTTLFLTNGAILCCGANPHRALPRRPPTVLDPLPLSLPGSATRVVLERTRVFVQRGDGGWFGRGESHPRVFRRKWLVGNRWCRVTEAKAARLSEQDDDRLIKLTPTC